MTDDTIEVQRERKTNQTTVRVTVEVESDGHMNERERALLADGALDSAFDMGGIEWDDDQPAPTRGNREI